MDISSLSIAMSQSRVQDQLSISLLKMNMVDSENMIDSMAEMISDVAVDTNLGQKIDVSV